jgi:AcrR family transcriptional regulator
MQDTLTAGPATELRNARSRRTRAAILTACRAMMAAGDFRPTVPAVAKAADCAMRTVFQHFHDVTALHREALDVRTRDNIVALIKPTGPMPEPLLSDCIAFAAVFGRPLPPMAEPAPVPAAAE